MCGRLTVFGTAGPTILVGEFHILGTHTDHGLNRNDHTFFQKGASASHTIIRHIRTLMHFEAYTMTAKFADDRVAVLLAMHLNSAANIANAVAGLAFIESNIKSLFSGLKKTLHLGSGLATSEGVSGIANITIQLNDAVKRDVVALIDEDIFARNAVNNDIVNGDTEGCGESLITFAERDTAIVANELLANLIKIGGGNTRTNMTAHLGESFTDEAGTVTYQFNFFFSL